MEEKYNAIVIRSTSYRENDKMLNLFTLENGLVSACLRGAKKANAKLKFAGELFCFGEYLLVEKNGRRTVTEVNQIDGFYKLRLDPDKFYVALSIVEFVSSFLIDGMKSYELFLAVINALKTLSQTDIEPKKILVAFYLYGLKTQGYQLNFDCCSVCKKPILERAFFSFSEGVSVCQNCATMLHTEIRHTTYSLLKEISKGSDFSFEYLQDLSFDDTVLINAIRFLDFAIKQIADINIKSHKIFIDDLT